jgi:ATP-dependent helicase/nuclease subunit B
MPVILTKRYDAPITDVEPELHRRIKAGRADTFFYVVPTRRKLRDLQRDFLRYTDNGVASAFNLFTLETLALTLHSISLPEAPKRPIAGPLQAVLVNEAMRRVSADLRYFTARGERARIPAGTLEKVTNVIATLKESGVYPSALYPEIELAELSERAKLQDILRTYEEYERLLGDRFIDAGGVLKELNGAWNADSAAAVRRRFPAVEMLVVAGFDEFSDPELTMLHHVSDIDGIGTVVSFDYHLGNDALFGHLRENYQKFLSMGFRKSSVAGDSDRSFRAHIAQHCFQPQPAKFPAAELVTLCAANDREDEIETIAKLVKHLVRQKPDRDLSRICVAMYRPQTYTALVREVFERYGIPANITDRYALDQSPVVSAILALLAVQQNNFRIADLMRALSSPYIVCRTASGEAVDAGNLYQAATLVKVTAGLSTWRQRIEKRLRFLTARNVNATDEYDDRDREREQQSLQKALDDLEAVSSMLRRFDAPMTPSGFVDRLTELTTELDVRSRLLDVPKSLAHSEHRERDARAYTALHQAMEDLLDVLVFEGSEDRRERLPFYLERLRTMITQSRYNIRQKYGHGVLVTSFDETRGLSFDVLFAAGLVDGEFPPPYRPEIFLGPERRDRIERYHLHEHRYLFYQAITNFTEQLYITIPNREGDVELVSSPFVDALLQAVELRDCRSVAPQEISGTIFSEHELLQDLGRRAGDAMDHREPLPELSAEIGEELRATFDHLVHAVRVERSRMDDEGDAFPEFGGRIGAHVSNVAVLEKFRERVYSVTQLESYGKCPFQFFAERVLRLAVPEEPEDGLSPIERGGVVHAILFEFYTARRERGLPRMSELNDDEFRAAVDDLLTIARRQLDELDIRDLYWDLEMEHLLGASNRKGVLREFLEVERAGNYEVRPSYFEIPFGPRAGPAQSGDPILRHEQPILAGAVKLRGKIDRVDIGQKYFKIIDYKTGRTTPGMREIELGISLQLPIYLYAVEHILERCVGISRTGAAATYYLMKSPVKEKPAIATAEARGSIIPAKSKQVVADDGGLREIIAQAIRFVNSYVDGIARGEFPIEPTMPEQVCRYCSFQRICRIQARMQVGAKP